LEEFLLSRKIYGPFESFPAHWRMLTPGAKLEDIRRFPFKGFPFPLTRQLRKAREIPDLHAVRVAIVDNYPARQQKNLIVL
jgi:hypothetical protein